MCTSLGVLLIAVTGGVEDNMLCCKLEYTFGRKFGCSLVCMVVAFVEALLLSL